MDIGLNEIRKWHLDLGWRDVGYHYIIRRNGEVELGRSIRDTGSHARGYNHKSVGLCLVEEIDIDKIDHRLKFKEDEQGLTQKEIWLKKYSYNNTVKK